MEEACVAFSFLCVTPYDTEENQCFFLGGARHAKHMKRASVKSYATNQGSSLVWKRASELRAVF